MISAVVSYHTNPYTCGVARFNLSLAHAMNLSVVRLSEYLSAPNDGVGLLSLKLEELDRSDLERLAVAIREKRFSFDLFLHGTDGSELERELCTGARRLFAASRDIAAKIESYHPRVQAAFAPGTPVFPRKSAVDCTLLTFGMAHKIKSDGYRRLASLLEADKRSFRLEISTALHEGGSFDETFFTISEEISKAFSGNVRFLGFLADAEVSERLQLVDLLVAFFPSGARENNTTVLSAMAHGCPVLTNLDAGSPPWMNHGETIFDIGRLKEFPSATELRNVGAAGRLVSSKLTFGALADIICGSSN
jgi:hypothetical protein